MSAPKNVMSPFFPALEFQGLAYYCDPCRLIIVDRGSSVAVGWLGRVLSSPHFIKLQVGLRLAQIGLRLGLVFVYLLFVVSWC